MKVKSRDTVKVHYTGKLDDGTVFDSSSGRDPLEFTVGAGQVIPGFDEAVMGLDVDESTTVVIPPDRAYGPHRPEMIIDLDRANMPADLDPGVGDQLQLTGPQGQTITATVTEAGAKAVTVDANHPLAGRDLTFEITVVAVT